MSSMLPTIQMVIFHTAGATSKNSATNHSTFQKKSELFTSGGGHVVPLVNNTTCFSKYKWLLIFPFFLILSSNTGQINANKSINQPIPSTIPSKTLNLQLRNQYPPPQVPRVTAPSTPKLNAIKI